MKFSTLEIIGLAFLSGLKISEIAEELIEEEKELITVLIDKYTDLQRIKKANNNVENEELEYQIRATTAKLSSMRVDVEDLTL